MPPQRDAKPMATPSARRIATDAGWQNLVEKQANKQQLRQAAKFRRRTLGGEDHLPAHRIYQNHGDLRCGAAVNSSNETRLTIAEACSEIESARQKP